MRLRKRFILCISLSFTLSFLGCVGGSSTETEEIHVIGADYQPGSSPRLLAEYDSTSTKIYKVGEQGMYFSNRNGLSIQKYQDPLYDSTGLIQIESGSLILSSPLYSGNSDSIDFSTNTKVKSNSNQIPETWVTDQSLVVQVFLDSSRVVQGLPVYIIPKGTLPTNLYFEPLYTLTDANGLAVFSKIPKGSYIIQGGRTVVEFLAQLENYQPENVWLREVTLGKKALLRGKVVLESGRSPAGTLVFLRGTTVYTKVLSTGDFSFGQLPQKLPMSLGFQLRSVIFDLPAEDTTRTCVVDFPGPLLEPGKDFTVISGDTIQYQLKDKIQEVCTTP